MPSLKLLIDRVYDVALTFDAVPGDIGALVAPYAPLSLAIGGRTVRLRLNDEGARVLELTEMLARARARHRGERREPRGRPPRS